jgi:DGQHR domain-containing protein
MPPAPANALLRRRALRINQADRYPLYVFTLTAQEVLELADISRVSRNEAGALIGYQRPEVRNHVQEIVDYLNSEESIFPNPIIVALSSRVRFESGRGPLPKDELATSGTLEIPRPQPGRAKPAWIVDGQQRALALARISRPDFPVPVTAFVTDSVEMQRDQFLRINNTRPLPRGLVTELLPEVDSPLPPRLAMRKAPSALCDLLNSDRQSPLQGMIRRASTGKDASSIAVITDTGVVEMIQESLTSPSGCLFPYRNMSTGETDFDGIRDSLFRYWEAVRYVFPEAWGLPPTKSRLMHGTGIRVMGRLMDRILGTVDVQQPDAQDQIRRHLALIAPRCHWTAGVWEDLGLRWNEVENLRKHTQELSNYLIRIYLGARAELR